MTRPTAAPMWNPASIHPAPKVRQKQAVAPPSKGHVEIVQLVDADQYHDIYVDGVHFANVSKESVWPVVLGRKECKAFVEMAGVSSEEDLRFSYLRAGSTLESQGLCSDDYVGDYAGIIALSEPGRFSVVSLATLEDLSRSL